MVVCRIIVLLWVLSITASAQSNRYIVFFADKNGTPYSISQPEQFLSQRSLARRAKTNVAVTAEDLPVTPSYVTQVRATGAKAFFTSRWMNALLIEATDAIKTTVSGLSFVSSVQLVAPGHKLVGGRKKNLTGPSSVGSASTDFQLQLLGMDEMHTDGFDGTNILLAVMDAGFPGVNTLEAFSKVRSNSQIKMGVDFVYNSGNIYQADKHGTEVISVIVAEQSGFQGAAPKTDLLLFLTEDVATEYRVEEYNWLFAAEKADSAGADAIQTSLGYSDFDDPSMNYTISNLDGKTTVVSKAASHARDRGIIVVAGAGNEGTSPWRYITGPSDVDGMLAVGAITQDQTKAAFSSFGPTSDGRIKPDVVALGVNTAIVKSTGQNATNSGTSFAAPLVSGLVCGILQAYPQYTPSSLVQAIRLSASQGSSPDNSLGYGIPSYNAVKNYLASTSSPAQADDILVYPNPAKDKVNVSFRNLPDGPTHVTIYDMLGRTLIDSELNITWQSNPLEILVSNISAGLYAMTVQTNTQRRVFRIVKH